MITYYLIHKIKRTVIHESNNLDSIQSYIDSYIPVSLLPYMELIVDN
jgi:hypothetical protein